MNQEKINGHTNIGSPVGLGIMAGDTQIYALRHGQEYEKNRIYYCVDENGAMCKFWAPILTTGKFWINYSENAEKECCTFLDKTIRSTLEEIKEMQELPVVIGFSLDTENTIWMHVQNYNPMECMVSKNTWAVPFKLDLV